MTEAYDEQQKPYAKCPRGCYSAPTWEYGMRCPVCEDRMKVIKYEAPEMTEQYNQQLAKCREVFLKKLADYGPSWRLLRPISITDQLFIKAWRIRTIQEKGEQQVADSMADDFVGLVNYAVIAIAGSFGVAPGGNTETIQSWDAATSYAHGLAIAKNHDYQDAWKMLSVETLTDLILVKLDRLKTIIRAGKLHEEEHITNYHDIINYALFALIHLK